MHIYEYTNPLIIHNYKILKYHKTATNLVAKPKLSWPHLAAQTSLADISLCVCVCVSVHVSVGVQWLQSCSTLCDPEDCSPSVSSVHGILQARILKYAAISFSRGSSWPRDRITSPALQANSLPLSHLGSPIYFLTH